jgi:hypothetical protein
MKLLKTEGTAHTTRFYEKFGLIKGKRKADVKPNNYFHNNEEAVEKPASIGTCNKTVETNEKNNCGV